MNWPPSSTKTISALLAGRPIDRSSLLARHPQLADALAGLERLATTSSTLPQVRPESAPRPERIGPYQIERELGAGGFGVVYLAYDPDVKRRVAIKVLHPGRLDQPEAVRAFPARGPRHRAAASSRHRAAVRLQPAGTAVLSGHGIRRGRRPARLVPAPPDAAATEIAELIAAVAEAVEHAHEQGVCHRDLKPGNILVDDQDRPHVLDFGLARLDEWTGDSGGMPTSDGHILGSLPYMAPEQAAGHSHEADARSDVYSLGVMLYELLTGRLPFQGPLHALPARVLEETRAAAAAVQSGPTARSGGDLSESAGQASRAALRHGRGAGRRSAPFLAGQSISARRMTMLRRIRRGLQRRHMLVGQRGWGRLMVALDLAIFAGSAVGSEIERRCRCHNDCCRWC